MPQIVMAKHEDWPGLARITTLRRSEANSRRCVSILCGNGGLFRPEEVARGTDGAMTGFAFPQKLTQFVNLVQAGNLERAGCPGASRNGRGSGPAYHPPRTPIEGDQLMDFGLTGKRALVLGTSGGLGAGCATLLAEGGASVPAVSRSGMVPNGRARGIEGRAVDLSGKAVFATLAEKSRAAMLQILVNNSGGPAPGPARGQSAAAWRGAFDAMATPDFALTGAALEGMTARKWGRLARRHPRGPLWHPRRIPGSCRLSLRRTDRQYHRLDGAMIRSL